MLGDLAKKSTWAVLIGWVLVYQALLSDAGFLARASLYRKRDKIAEVKAELSAEQARLKRELAKSGAVQKEQDFEMLKNGTQVLRFVDPDDELGGANNLPLASKAPTSKTAMDAILATTTDDMSAYRWTFLGLSLFALLAYSLFKHKFSGTQLGT